LRKASEATVHSTIDETIDLCDLLTCKSCKPAAESEIERYISVMRVDSEN